MTDTFKKRAEEILLNFISSYEGGDLVLMSDKRKQLSRVPEALTALTDLIKELVPKKQNRKYDEDYGYCITCNQISEPDGDCFCTVHNLAVDTILTAIERET